MQVVELIEWQPEWAKDFDVLAARIRKAAGSSVVRVDHIGSTSVPGMVAKDCIDVQAIVHSLSDEQLTEGLLSAGFTRSPGAWEYRDHVPERWNGDPAAWDKLVFRPPAGTRTGNVHVRVAGRPNERYALLFRDFLTQDQAAREAWAEFKRRLARAVTPDLPTYGQIKDPATDVLMAAAERWARETGWTPSQSVSAASATPRD
ncbi:GrpB family protein [Actinopolymorpha alba]|uniref:GrpB family protein n=1 Tax=Actinopolymorpha alba TaxID=533267 RepID=UPI0003754CC0|nr:GrpB family protein [Actinopolymorpha alba]